MKTEMVMPQMGESITEATVSRWLKKVGDAVTKDEIILEISTDKVDSEIPAPASGVIVELRCSEGYVVPVKTVIAIIDSEGKGTAAPAAASATPAAAPASAPKAVEAATQPQPAAAPAVAPAAAAAESISRFYSPLVMSLAQVNNISLAELETIAGSGQGGRVNKQDIMRHLDTRATTPTPAQPAPAQAATPAAAARPAAPAASKSRDSVPAIGEWQADGTKIIPMDAMRSAIAEHMVRSKATSPHVYSVQEVDVTNISKWRNANKKTLREYRGI